MELWAGKIKTNDSYMMALLMSLLLDISFPLRHWCAVLAEMLKETGGMGGGIMKFEFSFEEQKVLETVRKFATEKILPMKKQIEEKGELPEPVKYELKAMGLLKAPFSERYGGVGGTFTSLVLAIKSLCYASFVPAWPVFENFMLAYPIYKFGSDFLKETYLPNLIDLECMGALAFTEPNTGSDPAQIVTTAIKKDDNWVINGTKRFITFSGTCNYMILFAKTSAGITAFLIDTSNDGYKIGKRETFIHDKSLDNGDIYFENYLCPKDHVIGPEDQGFLILLDTEAIGKILFCAMFIGLAERAVDLAVNYAKTRLHRDKPIGQKFQMVQQKIAEMAVGVEAMNAYLFGVSSRVDYAKGVFRQAAGLKLFVAQQVRDITTQAMEVHGAYGLSTEYEIGGIFKEAIGAQVVMGSLDIQRVIVAKENLGW